MTASLLPEQRLQDTAAARVLREILVKNSVDGGQMGMGDDELENLKAQMKYCVIVVSTPAHDGALPVRAKVLAGQRA